MQQANSVGLSEAWASKVRNGQVNIETVTDEDLADKIKSYEQWYQKAVSCKEAIEELNETEKDLYKNEFDNIASKYDGILSQIEYRKSMIEESISRSGQSDYKTFNENHNNLVKSVGYYQDLIKQEQSNISKLTQERDALTLEFNEAPNNGIEKGSEKWVEMRDKINSVNLDISKAKTSILEYNNSISESYVTAFENVEAMYDNVLGVIENRRSMLDASISQTEAKGWLVSTEYYKSLKNLESENIDQMKKKRNDMITALNDAVANGKIKKKSQEWYDMKGKINDVTIAIEEANAAMIEYGNSIRNIEWSIFDMLQERISNITSEAEFLIDLMSNDKLYEDNGKLTDEGMSTMGLHGMNYNVYMAQADKYAKEMLDIDKKLAKDPYNQELINRRQELLELQQESILAAENEKQAIKDMVEEGIKKELEALQKLIDTYTDALDAQKDLYDYQKRVSEQTKEIASLQKQLSAYEGDLSEESKAKIQQIRVQLENAKEDLEETEYERYISDQKRLLDDLYNEYEEVLNQRLDDIDALISDMINEINLNADTISTTLSKKAESVGYTLSGSMKSIWETSTGNINSVITKYGKDFLSSVTTVNSELKGIGTNIQSMIKQLDTIAKNQTKSSTSSTSTSKSSSGTGGSSGSSGNSGSGTTGNKSNSTTTQSTSTTSTPTTSSTSNSNSGWGSWFISKKDSYPKSKLNINTSIVDRLKYRDIDSDFSKRKNYYYAMGGSGTYTGSASQNTWMISQMKSHGFAHGGIAKMIHAAGEDGISFLRNDEGIIPVEMMPEWKQLVKTLPAFNDISDKLSNMTIPSVVPEINQNVGDIHTEVNMDITLPGITNGEQFIDYMQHSKRFDRIVDDMLATKLLGRNSLLKYRH